MKSDKEMIKTMQKVIVKQGTKIVTLENQVADLKQINDHYKQRIHSLDKQYKAIHERLLNLEGSGRVLQ